ncbi:MULTISPECIES: phosphotriesterase family protein [unclassified Microbacterium]|uniref:phosphotriesterase family protein n=1 Tax=unclassified Microbacterium TaxID=2609290 RepID=UPI00300F82EF
MPDVQTVLGPVAATDLGIVLPHEHLFNDLSAVLAPAAYPSTRALAAQDVAPEWQFLLREDPYCCPDNLAAKPIDDVVVEVAEFRRRGGGTIVDATGSPAIGRDPDGLAAVARATGANVVMSTGTYLQKLEGERLTARSVDAHVADILHDLTEGIGSRRIRAGVIGEVGVSPEFTPAERAALRAAGLAQREVPHVPMNIHMPGWQRRGHEVLDVLTEELGVAPDRIALAHSDPSGSDPDYQRALLDRGAILEFDMIGLDISFPGEGASPSPHETADAVAALIADGYGAQLMLSQDLFLKQMWRRNGGNGLSFVVSVFADLLRARGLDDAALHRLMVANPARWLSGEDLATPSAA